MFGQPQTPVFHGIPDEFFSEIGPANQRSRAVVPAALAVHKIVQAEPDGAGPFQKI